MEFGEMEAPQNRVNELVVLNLFPCYEYSRFVGVGIGCGSF